MGYSHYWERPQEIQPEVFNAIGKDLLTLLPALESAGAPVANAYGREEPEVGPEFIGFNGVACCGHDKIPNLRLAWPAKDAHGTGENTGAGGTLPRRTCNGDCSFESLWFERVASDGNRERIWSACKTAFRPYDLAVTAFLVIVKHHLGDDVTVETDGAHRQWADAFALCQTELGYGAGFTFYDGQLTQEEATLCA